MASLAEIRRARPLLGTFVEIAAAGEGGHDLDAAVDAAFDAVARVHRLMSFHDGESDVSRLNRHAHANAVPVHPWTFQVLEAAVDLHRRSSGLFDVAIAPALQELGLLPCPEGGAGRPRGGAFTLDAIELARDGCIRFSHPGAAIDLGGIAKGFAVDRALDVLRERGVLNGLVNSGGDLAAFGPRAERVHIRDPGDARRAILEVEIEDAALASSGRPFDPLQLASARACAVIDPRTGRPVDGVVGATVRAPSCLLADALTKVVLLAGEGASGLLSSYRANALLVLESGDVWITSDWQGAVRFAA
jgi:FAD:protein FMN transferase